jgi:hypothetical protein
MILDQYNSKAAECGIKVHEKKPYISCKGVFLESYGEAYRFPWDHTKGSQWLGCLFDTLKAPTIGRAKEIFSTICLEVPEMLDPWISYIQDVVISYWGYEFHKDEYLSPVELGGWRYIIKDNFNMLFWWLMDQNENSKIHKLLNVKLNSHKEIPLSELQRSNKEYIKSIISRGWIDDPSHLSWKMMSKTALCSFNKGYRSLFRVEVKFEKKKQFYWKDKPPETMYYLTKKLWEEVNELGWYLPPEFTTSTSFSRHVREKVCEFKPRDFDLNRAYLHLTRHKGSILELNDPLLDYKSVTDSDLASYILWNISKGYKIPASDAYFALTYGYDYDKVYRAISGIIGDFTFKSDFPVEQMEKFFSICHTFKGIIFIP